MLQLGINYQKIDFNRKEVCVYHFVDDEVEAKYPICGGKIKSLDVIGSPERLIKEIQSGKEPSFHDENDRMCGKCVKAYLAPGTEAQKTARRKSRLEKRKKLKAEEREQFEKKRAFKQAVAAKFINACPGCASEIITKPHGFNDKCAECKNCNIKWEFIVTRMENDDFEIKGYHNQDYRGYLATGNLASEQLSQGWKKR